MNLFCGEEKPDSGNYYHDSAENDECQTREIGKSLAERGQLLTSQRRRGDLQKEVKSLDRKPERHHGDCGPHPARNVHSLAAWSLKFLIMCVPQANSGNCLSGGGRLSGRAALAFRSDVRITSKPKEH